MQETSFYVRFLFFFNDIEYYELWESEIILQGYFVLRVYAKVCRLDGGRVKADWGVGKS